MLNRLALRIATVRALRGQTLVGRHVLDSEQGAIEEIATDQPTPVIVVYTDDGQYHHGGRDLFHTTGNDRVGSGDLKLVIEMVITQRMQVLDDEGQPREEVMRPETDAAMAALLDITERQVLRALMAPNNAWAEVWRTFAAGISDRQTQLGNSAREGVRFAGRQLTLGIKLPAEPPPGEPLGPLWARFMALAATDPSLAPVLSMIAAELATSTAQQWDAVRGTFGLTEGEALAMLYRPPLPTVEPTP